MDWELINKWSSILTIMGFIITITSLLIALSIKSQVNKLRASYTFDKRINDHIRQLKVVTARLNEYFDNYDTSRNLIKMQLGICQSEMENAALKLAWFQRKKINRTILFIKRQKEMEFSVKEASSNKYSKGLLLRWRRLFKTSYDDVWLIYNSIHEIITQLENIKKDKDTILN